MASILDHHVATTQNVIFCHQTKGQMGSTSHIPIICIYSIDSEQNHFTSAHPILFLHSFSSSPICPPQPIHRAEPTRPTARPRGRTTSGRTSRLRVAPGPHRDERRLHRGLHTGLRSSVEGRRQREVRSRGGYLSHTSDKSERKTPKLLASCFLSMLRTSSRVLMAGESPP